jgi:transposase
MRAYSQDLRIRVLKASDEGLESDEVAERYSVSRSWVDRVKQRRREYGEVTPRRGSGRKPLLKPHIERLQELLRQQPDATLKEIREELRLTISLPAISKALKKMGYTFKKNPTGGRTRTT